jgi:hypothetical protein
VKTIVSNIPTTEEGCAFTTTRVKDLDEVLHPRKFYMSHRRAITLCIISMYLIQCSAMDAPWGKPGCSLQERSLKTISKCYAPVSGVAGPQSRYGMSCIVEESPRRHGCLFHCYGGVSFGFGSVYDP